MEVGPINESTLGKEPSIKPFIQSLMARLTDMSSDLHLEAQEYQTIQSSYRNIEFRHTETCAGITSSSLEAITQLEKKFKQQTREDSSDWNALKSQLSVLNQDKIRVEQSAMLLETRISETEKDIGIDVTLPIIHNKK